MTATLTAPAMAPLLPAFPGISAGRLATWAGRRVLALAALISLGALVAHAEITRQAWIPALIEFPADAEIIIDREIGSTLRMFSLTTDSDGPTLLSEWQDALEQGAYTISTGLEASIVDALEFTGPGIVNAKITASTSAAEGKTLLEFDATLE